MSNSIMRMFSLFLVGAMSSLLASTPPQPSSSEFINSWLVLGPFDNKDGKAFSQDLVGEQNLQPKRGASIRDHTWHYFDDRLFSRNFDDYQDLHSYFSLKLDQPEGAWEAYAHTYIFSPKDQPARLRVGCDVPMQAWLNRTSVIEGEDVGWERDSLEQGINLKKGWNSLLLKMGSVEPGRFGFYARICKPDGTPIPDLTISAEGAAEKLHIVTGAMDALETPDMPKGWREWPYVGARVDTSKFDTREGSLLRLFVEKPNHLLHSSDFQFQAAGGQPPYRWKVIDGNLPTGLSLTQEGRITGSISHHAELKSYSFVVRVTDSEGISSTKSLSIDVSERPNKWYQESGLTGLMHKPELMPSDTESYQAYAKLAKERGYQLIFPIAYNNGDYFFRYSSKYNPTPVKKDVLAKLKQALEAEGIKFGLYFGNLNVGTNLFTPNQQGLVIEEAIRKYKPAAIWFDWTAIPSESQDSLFSQIRTLDPNIVIVMNGNLTGSHGDWDVLCFEGWNAWGDGIWNVWPHEVPWPKKHATESWRLITSPKGIPDYRGDPDWREYLRVQLSLIGQGDVANIDISPTLTQGNPKMERFEDPLIETHRKMAAWANPAELPPLHEAYTKVNPAPITEASWGYATISLARDTIYLHALKNPLGKTGLPKEKTLSISPVDADVKAVTLMNTGKLLEFSQDRTSTDKSVKISTDGIVPDEVATIFKVELTKPLPPQQPPSGIPLGNLATGKSARLLNLDGTVELPPSGLHQPLYADRGVDGNPATGAAASGEWAWSYEVDLAEIAEIGRIVVNFLPSSFATEFKVLVSPDGDEWREVANKSATTGGKHEFTFPATKGRFVRVNSLKPDGPDQSGRQGTIAELEVYRAEQR